MSLQYGDHFLEYHKNLCIIFVLFYIALFSNESKICSIKVLFSFCLDSSLNILFCMKDFYLCSMTVCWYLSYGICKVFTGSRCDTE